MSLKTFTPIYLIEEIFSQTFFVINVSKQNWEHNFDCTVQQISVSTFWRDFFFCLLTLPNQILSANYRVKALIC